MTKLVFFLLFLIASGVEVHAEGEGVGIEMGRGIGRVLLEKVVDWKHCGGKKDTCWFSLCCPGYDCVWPARCRWQF